MTLLVIVVTGKDTDAGKGKSESGGNDHRCKSDGKEERPNRGKSIFRA